MPPPSPLLLIGVVAFGLLLSSCVSSVNPISSPKTSKPDLALIGDWTDNPKQITSTGRIFVTHAPWMRVVSIDAKGKMLKGSGNSFDFFPSTIGKDTFLNVLNIEKTPHGSLKSYIFYRYQISDGHILRYYEISEKLVRKAVRSGKLKGTIIAGNPDSVLIQDSSENIQAFILRSHPHKLFGNTKTQAILYKR